MSAVTATVAAVLTVVLVGAGPASAVDDELELSRDGTTWHSELTDPLFDASVRWVPGDARSTSFFVRNRSAQAGTLTIDILGSVTDALMETRDLSVEARGAGGDWTRITTAGTRRLLSEGEVAAGTTRQIDVTVAFDSASANASQVQALDLALRVRLTEDVDDARGPSGAGEDSSLLPHTGGPSWWFVVAGLSLALAGVTARRRARTT